MKNIFYLFAFIGFVIMFYRSIHSCGIKEYPTIIECIKKARNDKRGE